MSIFQATPTTNTSRLNKPEAEVVNAFVQAISERLDRVTALCWWAYRVNGNECIACDIYGVENSLNLTMEISGRTRFPEYPEGEPFELQDATDAWCLLSLLVERFELKQVRAIALGLQFTLDEGGCADEANQICWRRDAYSILKDVTARCQNSQ